MDLFLFIMSVYSKDLCTPGTSMCLSNMLSVCDENGHLITTDCPDDTECNLKSGKMSCRPYTKEKSKKSKDSGKNIMEQLIKLSHDKEFVDSLKKHLDNNKEDADSDDVDNNKSSIDEEEQTEESEEEKSVKQKKGKKKNKKKDKTKKKGSNDEEEQTEESEEEKSVKQKKGKQKNKKKDKTNKKKFKKVKVVHNNQDKNEKEHDESKIVTVTYHKVVENQQPASTVTVYKTIIQKDNVSNVDVQLIQASDKSLQPSVQTQKHGNESAENGDSKSKNGGGSQGKNGANAPSGGGKSSTNGNGGGSSSSQGSASNGKQSNLSGGGASKSTQGGGGGASKPTQGGGGGASKPTQGGGGGASKPTQGGGGGASKPTQGGGGGASKPTQGGGGGASKSTQSGGGGASKPTQGGGGGASKPTQGGGGGASKPTQGGGGGASKPTEGGSQQQNQNGSGGGSQKPSQGDSNKPSTSGGGNGQVNITSDQIFEAMSKHNFNPNAEYVDAVVKATNEEFSDINMAAMFIAQLGHESGGFQYIEEIECAGSTKCADQYGGSEGAPGKSYHGRGFIQLSWPANYKAASEALGMQNELWENPEKVAEEAELGAKVSIWFWKENVESAPGVSDNQFGATTKAINGALECTGSNVDKSKKRYEIYKSVAEAFGITDLADEGGCY